MHKTQQIWVKKGHRMYPYLKEMCEGSKNIQNTTNFYFRQVYTALTSEKSLQPLQKEVIDTINKHIVPMNEIQQLAYERKRDRELVKPEEDRKEVKCNLFSPPTKENPYVDYHFLDALFKNMKQKDYRSLPTQSSQWAMKQVFQNWKSFFKSLKDYKTNPHKYKARPRIPRYAKVSEKEVIFTNQDCVIKENKYVKFPKTKETLNIGKLGYTCGALKQIRVIPKYNGYVVELVMEDNNEVVVQKDSNRFMAIDIGNANLATITSNTGANPVLIKGKNVKSVNQYYNKQKAHYLSILRHGKKTNQGPFTSKRLERLSEKRYNKLKHLFHCSSKTIIDIALLEDVRVIFIGKNTDWKQKANMGKRNNQSFVSIPHSLLIKMIEYKAAEYGIEVIVTEESYTSKASFIDGDALPVYKRGEKHSFSGKRVKRGLYRTKENLLINADVNGSANIMRKGLLKIKKAIELTTSNVEVYDPIAV